MHDILKTIQVLRKNAAFTLLAVITLALGIGATTVAFTVLDTVLLRPLPFAQSDRLVFMREETDKQTVRPPSYPNFVDWRASARSFESVASAMYPYSETVTPADEPLRAVVMGVSQQFFKILGVPPFIGREFTVEENTVEGPRVVMVSHEFWQGPMGGRQPLGTIRMDDEIAEVVGVAPPGFRFVQDADIFVPHERAPGTIRSAHNYMVVGRLASGIPLTSAQVEMKSISAALRATYGSETEAVNVRMTPLREYLVGNYRTLLFVVFGAATLVLLIACTNMISAQLSRGISREREFAVRAAIGASRSRLAREMMTESGVVAAAATVLGTGFAALLIRVVRLVGVEQVPRLNELVMDGRILAFCGGLAILTTMLIGLYPAFRFSVSNPIDALRGAGRSSQPSRHSRVWPLLVGVEIAMAVVLLIGSGLLVRTMRNILNADPGFDARGLLTAALSPGRMDLPDIERLRNDLATLPGIAGVAFVNRYPLSWGNESGPVLRPTDPPDRWPTLAGFRVVSADYFGVMRQPVLMGRAFTNEDRLGTTNVAIVTEGLARLLWPGEDPLGKIVRTNYLSTEWQTVIGVVREASSWTMERGSQHEIFVPIAQHVRNVQSQLIAVVRVTGDPRSAISSLRAQLRATAPATPARFATMEDRISESAADRNFAMIALLIFAGTALLLAGIGIYGVMSHSITVRTHEIGVRMALGETPWSMQATVLRSAAAMAVGGIAGGLLLGSLVTRLLTSVLYGVTPTDTAAYAAGAVIILAVAMLSAYVPARRSSRIDPLVALREQ